MHVSSSIQRLVPLPALFNSDATAAPFTRCVECEAPFTEATHHVVEKAFRRYPGFDLTDTIFEYAMCLECAAGLTASMSQESLTRLGEYLSGHLDLERRLEWLQEDEPNPERWLAECIVKKKPAEAYTEYQIIGYCRGSRLLLSYFPYLIGEDAMNDMMALLSNETLDVLNDFSGRHFGLPPEYSLRTRFMPVL